LGEGIYPQIHINLPRQDEPDYQRLLEPARANLMARERDPLLLSASNQQRFGAESNAGTRVSSPVPSMTASVAPSMATTAGGTQGAAKAAATQARMELDAEVDRLKLKEFAEAQLAAFSNQQEEKARRASLKAERASDSSRPGTMQTTASAATAGTAGTAASKRSRTSSTFATLGKGLVLRNPDFALGRFMCDFGNVIKGSNKSKKFKVRNLGSYPVTFEYDKTCSLRMASPWSLSVWCVCSVSPSLSLWSFH
jgi:hypothetical protein